MYNFTYAVFYKGGQEKNNQINNLTYYLKGSGKEHIKPKVSRRKETIKIREEIK